MRSLAASDCASCNCGAAPPWLRARDVYDSVDGGNLGAQGTMEWVEAGAHTVAATIEGQLVSDSPKDATVSLCTLLPTRGGARKRCPPPTKETHP